MRDIVVVFQALIGDIQLSHRSKVQIIERQWNSRCSSILELNFHLFHIDSTNVLVNLLVEKFSLRFHPIFVSDDLSESE